MFKRQSGFTIVELSLSIIIIAILATLVIANYSGVQSRARDTERKTEVETIAKYLEQSFQKNGQYPSIATMTGSVSTVQAALSNISPNTIAAPTIAVGTNSIKVYDPASPPAINDYAYWTPNSPACAASYTVQNCATFVAAYKREKDNVVVTLCGRGANVNTAKAILAGPNGLTGFSSASCSNF